MIGVLPRAWPMRGAWLRGGELVGASMRQRLALVAVLLAAGAAALSGIDAGLRYLYNADELPVAQAAWRCAATGDWNPHQFKYGGPVIYLQTVIYRARALLLGRPAATGDWDDIRRGLLAGRVLIALASLLTVALTYRLGRELLGHGPALLATLFLGASTIRALEAHYVLPTVLLELGGTLGLLGGVRWVRTGRVGFALLLAGGSALALGAKYEFAALALPLYFGLVCDAAPGIRGRRPVWTAGILLAAVVGALALNPYVLLDRAGFLPFLRIGLAHQDPRLAAWPGHAAELLRGLGAWTAMGPGLLLLGIGGCLIALRRPRRPAAALGLVPLLWLLYYARSRQPFVRFLQPAFPALALAAAWALWALSSRVPGPRARRLVLGGALTSAVLPLLVTLRVHIGHLSSSDVRDAAHDWIMERLGPGDHLALDPIGPRFLEPPFAVTTMGYGGLGERPLEWFLGRGVTHLLASSFIHDSLPAEGAAGGSVRARYDRLLGDPRVREIQRFRGTTIDDPYRELTLRLLAVSPR
jgi:4-amino-4-deoxy-L-arabinose transferase-like glycosyltransferase